MEMKASNTMGLITSAFDDWSKRLINNRYIRQDNEITWIGYDKGIFVSSPSIDDFILLREKRQYSFQSDEDGGIFQLYYCFDPSGNSLIKANLSFYKPCNVLSYDSDPLICENLDDIEEENYDIEEESSQKFVSWIRIDYDPNNEGGVLHGESHMHVGGLPDARILVKGVPNPKQFVDFVMANFYPEAYRTHRCDADGKYNDVPKMIDINNPSLPVRDTEAYPLMSHIYIPVNN